MRKIALVIVLSFVAAACQKSSNIIIDNSQPVNAQLTYFDKDSLNIGPYLGSGPGKVTISDSFRVKLSSVQNFSYLEVNVQNDSGAVLNDLSYSNPVDSTIAGSITTTITNVYVGDITYTFTAYNDQSAPGNYSMKVLRLYDSGNQPPVIDSVSAPDSVQIDPSSNVIFDLYARVSDPSGLSNIERVFFNTTKPDGTPSTGNPFLMYDDGGASQAPGDDDKVANDGIYTLAVQLPPTTTLGTYSFTFYAVDRSGISSTPVSHSIKVYK